MTEQTAQAPLTKEQRYSFVSCLIDATGWALGIAFFSTSTIAPAFMSHLGAGSLLIGLLPAFVNIGYNMTGAFVANYIVRLPRAKRWLFPVAIMERIPLMLMAISAFVIHSPTLLLSAFLILYALHAFTLGVNQPAYWVVIAKTVPAAYRGRLFGLSNLVGGILGFGVYPITSHFLKGSGTVLIHGFGWCFVLGAIIELLTCLPLAFVNEPFSPAPDPAMTMANGSRFKAIWRSNREFRHFVWGQVLFSIWMIATPFYLLDAAHRLHLGGDAVGLYATVGVVVAAFGCSLCGFISDRYGNRLVLLVSSAAAVFASIYVLTAPDAGHLSVVFALSAFATAGAGLAGYNITMEFAPTEQDVPHYIAFYNVIVSPVRAVALVIGGLISQGFDFAPVFLISTVAAVITIFLVVRLIEPRHANLSGRMEEPRP